jgi:hypothetical protein
VSDTEERQADFLSLLELEIDQRNQAEQYKTVQYCSLGRGDTMKDMQAHLEKLITGASECALIASLATDKRKRDLFARLAEH